MSDFIFLSITKEELVNLIDSCLQNHFQGKSTTNKIEAEIEWLTRKEAASLLHISLPTLDLLTRQQKINAHRIGRKKLYNKNDMNKAINFLKIKYK